jgi:hypothetical protein
MKRALLVVLAGLMLALALSGVALAWTPQDLYNDWADNGKLDRTYTNAELNAYLNDPTIHQYGDSSVLVPLDGTVTNLIKGGGRSSFPWTGLQIAAVLFGAVILIALGILLRRSGRQKRQEEKP